MHTFSNNQNDEMYETPSDWMSISLNLSNIMQDHPCLKENSLPW
jgi:hypothetical protein